MPVAFAADSGADNIDNVTNTEPVNAATANRPHIVLRDRTDVLETFANESEATEIFGRGLALYSEELVTWGGALDDSGDGIMSIGNNATGEIRFVEPGNANGLYLVPFNHLATWFGANKLNLDDVLYFDLTNYAGRAAASFPVTITDTDMGKATAITKYQIPICKVVAGDSPGTNHLVFAFTGDMVMCGTTAYIGSFGGGTSWSYGDDYELTGHLEFLEHAGDIEITPTLTNLIILFSNKYGVQTNAIVASSLAVSLGQQEIAYVDLDLINDGALLTVSKANYFSYTPAPTRLPLWSRGPLATENQTNSVSIYMHGPGTTFVMPDSSGADGGWTYGQGSSMLKIGSTGAVKKGRIYLEDNAGGDAAGLIYRGEWVEEAEFSTVHHTDASGKVQHIVDTGGAGAFEILMPDTSTVKIDAISGGNVNLIATGDIIATQELRAKTGNVVIEGTSDVVKYLTARQNDVFISASAFHVENGTLTPRADGNYKHLEYDTSTTAVLVADVTPFLVEGGIYNTWHAYASGDDINSNVFGDLYEIPYGDLTATAHSSGSGQTSTGLLATVDEISMEVGTLALNANKILNRYHAVITLQPQGTGDEIYFTGIRLVGTFNDLERPG